MYVKGNKYHRSTHIAKYFFWSKWDHMVRIYDLGALHVFCMSREGANGH
jgi:hypothetical protein